MFRTQCFQTSTNSHWQCFLNMSHTQDMVMITPANSLENFAGEIFFLINQIIIIFWTHHVSMWLLTPIKVKYNPKKGVRNIQKSKNCDFQRRWLPWNMSNLCYCCFKKVTLYTIASLHVSDCLLARHILLTGLSLVSAWTSPLIQALIVDSADRQHQ